MREREKMFEKHWKSTKIHGEKERFGLDPHKRRNKMKF